MFSIPNKPPISLTPRAVSHIKLLMDNSDALALRLGVKKGGCAGMEYTIEYVTESVSYTHLTLPTKRIV